MNTTWKTIRVFISSTFRDMQAERDHLVRFVFPQVREHLLPRRIHLVDVDLRWGVTSEQDASEVCREIIDECRPRFICMLGGRYGWVPPGRIHSITADEVYYGVLNRTLTDRGFAYFYFRDDGATAGMVETTANEFREPHGSENQSRLADLKQAIAAAELNPFTYPAKWDNDSRRLTGLKKFGDRVYEDLLAGIRSDPELRDRFLTDVAPPLDEYAEENSAMETFIEERSEHFVPGSRQIVLDELLAFACAISDKGYVYITGAPGSGKSALLAHLSKHSALTTSSSILTIRHFVGASPGSTNVRRTLRRLCNELKAGCIDITTEIPDDPEELRVALPDFLRQASEKKRIVILLDAVNQFESVEHSTKLHWLPEELPANARIILSVLDGQELDELGRRQMRKIDLLPLTSEDAKAIIEEFLKRYRKKFERAQLVALLAKTDVDKPLYLMAALEELRTLGTYEDITRRIDELPPTTQELFAWILGRLANDDGFRDPAGRRIGLKLVSSFAALLSASRYGLSQRELTDLLDMRDPQGNVAALLRLLNPYLMRRGELLNFYHGQLRDAAETAWLKTKTQVQTVHAQLADYFRNRADPDNNQLWELNPRLLAELPFHVAHAAREKELHELLSQLAFLSARVGTGGIYEQVADYSLAGSLPLDLAQWHDFLQKHAQKLAQHPSMLVALANHEGFPEARAQAASIPWRQPWLRTSPEKMPPGEALSATSLHVQVVANFEFPWGRVSAIAPQPAVAFYLDRLGTICVLDLRAMRQTDAVLSIRRDRPLVLACAPDATSLAIFYESGDAELYRCICKQNGWPVSLELVVEFPFLLPESENPVVVWHKSAFWYQSTAGALASISVESPHAAEETLHVDQHGELSALLFSNCNRLVALRQGPDTLLFTPGAPPLRRQATQLAAACACGEKEIAAAFTDGALVVFELGAALTTKAEVRAGILRGALGWDGSRLLWLTESSGFSAWNRSAVSPLPVQDNQEVFPSHLHIIPRQWLLQPDGSLLLGTTHSLVNFRLLDGGAATDGRLQDIFGGPVWRAVLKRGKDQWLLEKQSLRETLLGRGVMGRLFCALDGKGRFFAASGYGPGLAFDLSTLQSTPLQGCPVGINVAVGEDSGGCWFTDRAGDIYFVDELGQCHCAAKSELTDVHGSRLQNCGNHLVWEGYSGTFFQESGVEPARTFIFFNKTQGNPPELERLGEQFRHPREGLCVSVCYDKGSEKLVTLWVKETGGLSSYSLRIGPVRDFARWQFQEIEVSGLGEFRFLQADLSANGRFLGVVNMSGEISCLSVAEGRVFATLAGSAPFTAVAAGADGSEFWLVEASSNIYRCSLVEGTV